MTQNSFFFGALLSIASFSSCSSGANYDEANYESEKLNSADEYEGGSVEGCGFDDDTYSATVHYNNSETGYSATYTLDVEVEDCQIVQINFPNDGYLDEDHISYADIESDGSALVYGEDGKTYEIELE
jgi:hypothetical protein